MWINYYVFLHQMLLESSRRFAIFKLFACFELISNNLNEKTHTHTFHMPILQCGNITFARESTCFVVVVACAGILCVHCFDDMIKWLYISCMMPNCVFLSCIYLWKSSHRFLFPSLYDVKVGDGREKCSKMYIYFICNNVFLLLFFWVLIFSFVCIWTTVYIIKMYCCLCICLW